MYRVIKFFTDLQDGGRPYNVGDTFPRDGVKVNDKRLQELSGSNNKRHTPLIEEVKEDVPEINGPIEPQEEKKPKTRAKRTKK